MDRIKFFIFAAMALLAVCSSRAEGWKYITKNSVNMRAGASTNAKVVMKGDKGMAVQPIATEGTWTKVKTLPGTEAYVSTQFLADLPLEELYGYSCVIGKDEAENAMYEIGYSMTETGPESEATTTWIPMAEDNSGKILASYSWEYANTYGSMRSVQYYYTGRKKGWYIELTDMVDYDYRNPEKLETPIYIYPAYGTDNIYVNDQLFKGTSDEWGD